MCAISTDSHSPPAGGHPDTGVAPPTPKYFIRAMRDDDIPQALNIDHEAFSTQWPPLSYSALKQELRNRLARYIVLCTKDLGGSEERRAESPLLPPRGEGFGSRAWGRLKSMFQRSGAAQAGAPRSFQAVPSALDTVIGFAGIWKMADEVHLITIAVKGTYRGQGLGELLLISVIDMALGLGSRVITLEVRISNRRAQVLYVKYGFRSAGVRHVYYSDNNEDALIMTSDNITTESFKLFFQKLKDAHAARWCEAHEGA